MAFPKARPIILERDEYKALQLQCFAADKWRCLICKKIRPLQLHHVHPRSRGRLDVLENAMSLCAHCHAHVTENRCEVRWEDVSQRTVVVTWAVSARKGACY